MPARKKKTATPKDVGQFMVLGREDTYGSWECCCGERFKTKALATAESEKHVGNGDYNDVLVVEIVASGKRGGDVTWEK